MGSSLGKYTESVSGTIETNGLTLEVYEEK